MSTPGNHTSRIHDDEIVKTVGELYEIAKEELDERGVSADVTTIDLTSLFNRGVLDVLTRDEWRIIINRKIDRKNIQ